MRRLVSVARRFYGDHPLHLLVLLGSFALFAYVILTLGVDQLWNPQKWWQSIAVWFVAAVVAHDLILFPLYAVADRSWTSAVAVLRRRRRPRRALSVSPVNYLRLPVLASALTGILFLPGIIAQGSETYVAATGLTQDPFLTRWLLLCAGFFVASAIAYAVRLALSRRAPDRPVASR